MHNAMKAIRIAAIISLLAVLASCDSRLYYEQNRVMDDEEWLRDSVLEFSVPVTDTLQAYNILFNNRITGQYPYSNMYLFITIAAPDKSHQVDTLECILADSHGKWLGSGFGNVWTNNVYYKKNVKFPKSGTYTFYIEQAMRVEKLPHVLSAGIRIEKNN